MGTMHKSIYLDYNATTPLSPSVVSSIYDALVNAWGNPSSSYAEGKKAKEEIAEARKNVASCINAVESDIIFTSGGSESNNWVIDASVNFFKSKLPEKSDLCNSKPHIITSTVEHDSIIIPLMTLLQEGIIELTQVPINVKSGVIESCDVVSCIKPNTCLVTIMMANNETGVIMPIKEIMTSVQVREKEFGSRILLHTDAAQTIGKVEVDVQELNVDFLTIVGHKLYGPRIGALFIKNLRSKSKELKPFIYGGGQEKGWRSGTENTPMIVGLGMAAKEVNEDLNRFKKSMQESRDYLEERLVNVFGNENVRFNCKSNERLPNTCNVSFLGKGLEGYKILQKAKSFSCSTGSACHSGSCKPSKLLTLFHIPDHIAANAIRLSTGRETTTQDIDVVVKELHDIIRDLSQNVK